MKEAPGLNHRRFCGVAAATVAASPLEVFPVFFFSQRSTAMNTVAQPKGSDTTANRH
jgi:hypothetical protein